MSQNDSEKPGLFLWWVAKEAVGSIEEGQRFRAGGPSPLAPICLPLNLGYCPGWCGSVD